MKKMLTALLLCLILCGALQGVSLAASIINFPYVEAYNGSGTCGENLTWEQVQTGADTIKLTIRGTGPMDDYAAGSQTPWKYTHLITEIVIEEGVTSVGDYAFDQDYYLQTVSFPSTLTRIGDSAFQYSQNLRYITLPPALQEIGEYAFMGSGILRISIPDTVTRIGRGAFLVCEVLDTVLLPAGITSIEFDTFYGCHSLGYVQMQDNVTRIGEMAFAGCPLLHWINIPAGVVSIGTAAFTYSPGEVHYAGSKAMWTKIDFGEENEPIRRAYIIYQTPDPSPVAVQVTVTRNNQPRNMPNEIRITSNAAFDGYSVYVMESNTRTEYDLPYPATESRAPVLRLPEDDNLVRNLLVTVKYGGESIGKAVTLTWDERVELPAPDVEVEPSLSSEEDVNIWLEDAKWLPAGTVLEVERSVGDGYGSNIWTEHLNDYAIPVSDFTDLEYPDEDVRVYGLGEGGWAPGHYRLTCRYTCGGYSGPEKTVRLEIIGGEGRSERPVATMPGHFRAGEPVTVTFPEGVSNDAPVYYILQDTKQNNVTVPASAINGVRAGGTVTLEHFGLDAGEYMLWMQVRESGKKYSDSEVLYFIVTGERPAVPPVEVVSNNVLINGSNSIRMPAAGIEDYLIVRYRDAARSQWSYSLDRGDFTSGWVGFSETAEGGNLLLNLGTISKTDEREDGTWYFTLRARKNGCWSAEGDNFSLTWRTLGPAPLPSFTLPTQLRAGEPLIMLVNEPFPEGLYMSLNIYDSGNNWVHGHGVYDYNVNEAERYPMEDYVRYEGLPEGSYQYRVAVSGGGYTESGPFWYPLTVAGIYVPEPDPVDSGMCGEQAEWALSGDGVLTIRGAGPMYDYESESGEGEELPPWIRHRENIRSVVVKNGVTRIGNNAFYGFPALTGASLADSVAQIGGNAFRLCEALTDIVFSAGLEEIEDCAFTGCAGLTAVTLPAGLKRIGWIAFAECGLTEVRAEGEGRDRVLFYAMDDGDRLIHIQVPVGIEEIGEGAFYDNPLPYEEPDLILPADLETIEDQAFYGIDAKYVRLHYGIRSIGSKAFAESAVRYAVILQSCESIAPDAFPEGTVILGFPREPGEISSVQDYAEANGYGFVPLENPFGGNG